MQKEYPTSVHLTRALRSQLRQVAKQEKRSVSSQIRFILNEWMEKRRPDLFEKPLPTAGGQAEQPQAGDA